MDKNTKQRINQLILNIKKDDRDSLNELHAIIGATIRHIALKYLKDDEKARELIQDFWVNIHKIASRFTILQNGFSFLCKSMTNMSIDRYRKIKNERKTNANFVDYSEIESSQEFDYESLSNKIEVEKALEKLSIAEKVVVQLTYFEDKTIRDIAKDLHISKTQVGRIKETAMQKLSEELEHLNRDKMDD